MTDFSQVAARSAPPDAQHYQFSNLLGPDDLSPTKQEEKFSNLRSEIAEDIDADGYVMVAQDHYRAPNPLLQYTGQQPQILQEHVGNPEDYFPRQSNQSSTTYPQHFPGEPSLQFPLYHNEEGPPSPHPGNAGTSTPRQKHPGLGHLPSSLLPYTSCTYEEPYDATREMQKFIAEDKARKRGKTVIYNPEMHSETESICQGVDYEPFSANSIMSPTRESTATTQASLAGVLEPLKTLESPKSFFTRTRQMSKEEEAAADRAWEERMEKLRVDDKFFCLRPTNAKDRKEAQAAMANAAKSFTITAPDHPLHTDDNLHRLQETEDWFYKDCRGAQDYRQQQEHNVEREAETKRAVAAFRNHGKLPSGFKVGLDDGLAFGLAMSHVEANIKTYVECKNYCSIEQRRNFFKVKPPPDWAVARSDEETMTYFGGAGSSNMGTWIQPPQRVARDPRFRTAPGLSTNATVAMPESPSTPSHQQASQNWAAHGIPGGPIGGPVSRPRPIGPRRVNGGDVKWQQRVDRLCAYRKP